jgi:hypothetical protein
MTDANTGTTGEIGIPTVTTEKGTDGEITDR